MEDCISLKQQANKNQSKWIKRLPRIWKNTFGTFNIYKPKTKHNHRACGGSITSKVISFHVSLLRKTHTISVFSLYVSEIKDLESVIFSVSGVKTAIFSFMLPEDDAKNVVYVNSNVEQLELGRNFRDFWQEKNRIGQVSCYFTINYLTGWKCRAAVVVFRAFRNKGGVDREKKCRNFGNERPFRCAKVAHYKAIELVGMLHGDA